ncbi:MAG: DUF4440 domain-containing protein [Phenylobacterium sp.]|uniref:DUF4440 domain-containing protein n=1 Tax=Phenylobacterium sp. TaxID=1871053 RepID=UPI0025F0F978|nr:DUF4440 domain-containing protein [Phenylobacterium sp.]MBI1198385.1 DUF4440 domain-containing protein [Phenylobacterium sp.]
MTHRPALRAAAALAAIAFATSAAGAPAPDEAAALATVQRFFDAMAAVDRATLAEVTFPDGVFTAVGFRPNGERRLDRIPVGGFIAGLKPGFHEAMWDPQIRLRGDLLATVSGPYEFQADGKTTHCGVDVFDLVKADGQWRIAALTWTAEPDACPALKAARAAP